VRCKIIFAFVLALALTVGPILASQSFSQGNNALSGNYQSVEKSETVFVESSWARWYPDFESLMGNFDLVVVGKVIKSQLDPQDQVFTYHEVFVQDVIKDSSNEVKEGYIITIHQFGGIWAPNADSPPAQVEFRDSPLMKEGETSLLFLNDCDGDKVFGGVSPQTRFIVEDGKMYWLGAVYENRGIGISVSENLQIEGEGLREIISMLQQLPYAPIVVRSVGLSAFASAGVSSTKRLPAAFPASKAMTLAPD
jgi:hypothetical protein